MGNGNKQIYPYQLNNGICFCANVECIMVFDWLLRPFQIRDLFQIATVMHFFGNAAVIIVTVVKCVDTY